ncbi:MAG: winged helix-turn-helix transcriptional regulator [Deltaproteobacteria bacterium]|nr:winged helix-turn-helix transcriptional regulator [Deltaproteobacteria bacterium]
MAVINDILFAFSDEARLRMALLLEGSALCVNCLVKVLDMPQPTVSRHLAILKRTGVVATKRDGLYSYYSLSKEGSFGALGKRLVRIYGRELAKVKPFMDDRERLEELSRVCAADCRTGIK